MRLLLGLLKGGIIGGGLGYGYHYLGLGGGVLDYVLYGLIGALVGFIAGRPFWKHETIWTPVVKAVVGFGICLGLYALAVKVLGDPKVPFLGPEVKLTTYPFAFGALVGTIYGIFVEIDDGGATAGRKSARSGGGESSRAGKKAK